MKIENIKNEFPQMPEEIRERIWREVEMQVRGCKKAEANGMFTEAEPEYGTGSDAACEQKIWKMQDRIEGMGGSLEYKKDGVERLAKMHRNSGKSVRKHKRSSRRMIVAVLAAALVLGTTVIAGTQFYRMYTEKIGKYGMKTTVELGEKRAEDSELGTQENVAAVQDSASELLEESWNTEEEDSGIVENIESIQNITASDTPGNMITEISESVLAEMQFGNCIAQLTYLPEGIIQAATEFQYYYEEKPWIGGLSFTYWKMDSEESFEMLETSVMDSQEIQVAGHDGVYMKRQVDFEESERSFDKMIYIAYPEEEIVLQMCAAQNVSKEEALKVAEGIRVMEQENPEQEDTSDNAVLENLWSDFLDMMFNPETEVSEQYTTVSKEVLSNTHVVGEEFSFPYVWAEIDGETGAYDNEEAPVEVKVSEVQVMDDASVLDPAYMENLQEAFDSSGNLLPNTIKYIKSGDGIESLDEEISVEQEPLKLIYVTAEYTNRSDKVIENLLFFGVITKIEEKDDEYVIYDRAEHTEITGWDRMAYSQRGVEDGGMMYYDVQGGESNGTNYIDCLEPGQTQVVHFGFLVHEDELPYMYLSLSGSGGTGLEFSESSLELGYVDIRQ